jgi:hypothetical protein
VSIRHFDEYRRILVSAEKQRSIFSLGKVTLVAVMVSRDYLRTVKKVIFD